MGRKGKAKGGKSASSASPSTVSVGPEKTKKLKACNHVRARHILCEKMGKINEAYKELSNGWLDSGDKVPPAKFGEIAQKFSECPSSKRGGDLGWFPRGKMDAKFQDVAFSLEVGECSKVFPSSFGYHIILCEGRKA
eukprot:TRINITY_DN81702_c0_g1_i1.p1 TRINITY_DN81702_c0_g1~~TRINITY_DN81702_c0_g1_i1.p1  ORF type:complete len:159 (-),score=33.73 TRINITY_DN81702_c0_g1_i1:167-577(-)